MTRPLDPASNETQEQRQHHTGCQRLPDVQREHEGTQQNQSHAVPERRRHQPLNQGVHRLPDDHEDHLETQQEGQCVERSRHVAA